jgi:hypothetical protein
MMYQLRTRTNDQAATIHDIHYQQVLNNLAMIIEEPGKLPYFCDPQTARTTITDIASINDGLGWSLITSAPAGVLSLFDRFLFTSQSSTFAMGQNKAGEWDAVAVNDPDRLQLMRTMYRRVAGNGTDEDEQLFVGFYFQFYKVTDEALNALQLGSPDIPPDLVSALRKLVGVEYTDEAHFLADVTTALKLVMQPQGGQAHGGGASIEARGGQVATFEPFGPMLDQGDESMIAAAGNVKKRDSGNGKKDEEAAKKNDEISLRAKRTIGPYWASILLSMRRADINELVSRPFVGDEQYYYRTYAQALQPGWYGVGRRRNVPRNAEYVGCYGNTYVWVLPENVDMLSRLTLAMLDLETAPSNRRPPGLVASVR